MHVPCLDVKCIKHYTASAKHEAVQVLYNAQMIRTWSLLLRNAQRLGYIVSGRQVSKPILPMLGPVRSPCGMVHGKSENVQPISMIDMSTHARAMP